MKLEIVEYTDPNDEGLNSVLNGANIILKNRLYVNGWIIKTYVDRLLSIWYPDRNKFGTFIAYVDDSPVGTLLYRKHISYIETHTYVKKPHRRKGIGTELVKRFLQHADGATIEWDEGIRGSGKFYSKVMPSRQNE